MKKKYCIVGTGGRALMMFGRPLTQPEFVDWVGIAGLYDPNASRADYFSEECGGLPVFDDFDDMLRAVRPDAVIVTSVDCTHDDYIVRALHAGCDVISEKPMTTDVPKCRRILEAEKETGKHVQVTFNCRFMPYMVRVKELIRTGALGDIYNVDLRWKLDRSHGADYYRRWHRYLKNSGSLLVHKSTHHFDLVNWWIGQEPVAVSAAGRLNFYGKNGVCRAERCASCADHEKCGFYFDLKSSAFDAPLYLGCEKADGYYRDRCVFAPDIDIYDTMSVTVEYSAGALMSYSLISYSPYEGFDITITGSKGRLEAEEFFSGPHAEEEEEHIRLYSADGKEQVISFPKTGGLHGGGDERLREMVFKQCHDDPLGQVSESWDGAKSMLIGACANLSIREKRRVVILDELNR